MISFVHLQGHPSNHNNDFSLSEKKSIGNEYIVEPNRGLDIKS